MNEREAEQLRAIDPSVLGARIRAARNAAGMTQNDLASKDVTISYISRIESGQRRPDGRVLEILAKRLDSTLSALLEGPSDEICELRLQVDYAEIALELGDAAEALRRVDALLRSAKSSATQILRRARYVRARALEASGRIEAAIDELEGLVLKEEDGVLAFVGGIALSRCYREMGDTGRAITVGERLLEKASDWDLLGSDEAIQLTVTVAAAYFEHGDTQYAVRLCRRASETAERTGSTKARASAYWNASVLEMKQGSLPSAVALAQRSLAMLGEGADARSLARLRSQLGMMQLQLDPPELDEAEANLEAAAESMATSSASQIDKLRNQLGLARVWLLRGDYCRARTMAAGTFEATADAAPLVAADARSVEGQAAAALGDIKAAQSAFRSAVMTLAAVGADRRAAQLWLDLGALLDGVGDVDASRDAYRSAAVSAGLRLRGTGKLIRQAAGD